MLLTGFFLGMVFLDGNLHISTDENARAIMENFTSSVDELYSLTLYEELILCKDEKYNLSLENFQLAKIIMEAENE